MGWVFKMKKFLGVMGCSGALSFIIGYLFWGMMLPWLLSLVGVVDGTVGMIAKVLIVYAVIYGGGVGIPLVILFVGFIVAINVADDF